MHIQILLVISSSGGVVWVVWFEAIDNTGRHQSDSAAEFRIQLANCHNLRTHHKISHDIAQLSPALSEILVLKCESTEYDLRVSSCAFANYLVPSASMIWASSRGDVQINTDQHRSTETRHVISLTAVNTKSRSSTAIHLLAVILHIIPGLRNCRATHKKMFAYVCIVCNWHCLAKDATLLELQQLTARYSEVSGSP